MIKKTKLIVIVDGNNFAWRAYSTRNLSTSTGIPTSVISGILQQIKFIYNEFRYDRLIICWDHPKGGTFRKDILPEYKANREENREKHKSIFSQITHARKFFKTLNVRQAMFEGIEGDDVMSLVANHYAGKKHNVIIASTDKDLLQLITPRIRIYRPITKELIDTSKFKEMYGGLSPKDLIKVKSLMGDKGDNIPGINGIGEKGAIKIVKEFKTLKNIMKTDTKDRKVKMVKDNIKVVNRAFMLVKIIISIKEIQGEHKKRFLKTMKSFKGKRKIDWMKLKGEFKRLEMKHRNFNSVAEQLSLRVD
jgi:DNA polymerase-1